MLRQIHNLRRVIRQDDTIGDHQGRCLGPDGIQGNIPVDCLCQDIPLLIAFAAAVGSRVPFFEDETTLRAEEQPPVPNRAVVADGRHDLRLLARSVGKIQGHRIQFIQIQMLRIIGLVRDRTRAFVCRQSCCWKQRQHQAERQQQGHKGSSSVFHGSDLAFCVISCALIIQQKAPENRSLAEM